jgi:hypothetical protein
VAQLESAGRLFRSRQTIRRPRRPSQDRLRAALPRVRGPTAHLFHPPTRRPVSPTDDTDVVTLSRYAPGEPLRYEIIQARPPSESSAGCGAGSAPSARFLPTNEQKKSPALGRANTLLRRVRRRGTPDERTVALPRCRRCGIQRTSRDLTCQGQERCRSGVRSQRAAAIDAQGLTVTFRHVRTRHFGHRSTGHVRDAALRPRRIAKPGALPATAPLFKFHWAGLASNSRRHVQLQPSTALRRDRTFGSVRTLGSAGNLQVLAEPVHQGGKTICSGHYIDSGDDTVVARSPSSCGPQNPHC